MEFKDIKIVNAEKATQIGELKEGFYRIIFKCSIEYPPKEWVKLFSEKYNSIKSLQRKIESWNNLVIVHCRLNELQAILDDLKKAALFANEEYKKYLIEMGKKEEKMQQRYKEERSRIDESINKLDFS